VREEREREREREREKKDAIEEDRSHDWLYITK